jgi:hypothetical protein
LALALEMFPVVSPQSNRLTTWQYDKALCMKRNQVERLFRHLKGVRRRFSRLDKLDVVFLFFIHFAMIPESLTGVNRPC